MDNNASEGARLLGPNGQLSDGAVEFLRKCSELSPAGKRHVIRALQAQAGIAFDEVEVQCILGVRRFFMKTGKQSADAYQQFLNGLERPHDYPSVTRIRKTLGGPQRRWTEVRARVFGLGTANPIASRVTYRQAIRCSRARIIEIVQEYCGDDAHPAVPTMEEVLAWSRGRALDVGTFERPYLVNHKPIYREFEGWLHCLEEAAVLVDRLPEALVVDGVDVVKLDPRAREFIRAAHLFANQEGHALTRDRLLAYLEQMTTDSECPTERLGHSVPTFMKVCGRWEHFLALTGLNQARSGMHGLVGVEVSASAATRAGEEQFSDEEMFGFLRGAVKQHGTDVNSRQIRDFRRRLLREAKRQGRDIKVPTRTAIRARFKSVALALAHAGVISVEEAIRRTPSPAYSPKERIDALEEAIRACGRRITEATYTRYRDKCLEKEPLRLFPSLTAVVRIDEENRRFSVARAIVIEQRGLADVPESITDLRG
jgi:hypothetical protein